MSTFLSLLSVPTASAQFLGKDAATAVGSSLTAVTTGGFGDIAITVALNALPFINGGAILTIVIAGMLSIVAQDENRIATARKVVAMAATALILINISARMALAYMTAFNMDAGANPGLGASILTTEILGVITFLETPVVIIAIITIISYGIKAVVDYNGENGIQAFRKAIIAVLTGIIIIVAKFLIVGSVLTGSPAGITVPAVRVLFTVVGFTALVAVTIIVLAGVYLIVNIADESRAEKAKGVIISITAGMVFMIVLSGLLAILIDGVFA